MEGFTPVEIAFGRYFIYGAISFLVFLKIYLQGGARYPLNIWLKAIGYSLSCTVGYYIFVIFSMRYSNPAICTIILGVAPITIAFYGNWKLKECSFRCLIFPSVLVLIGLVSINAPHIIESSSPSTYLLGLVLAMAALLAWTWYVVANSDFLKTYTMVKSEEWATLIGVSTLFWVFALGLVSFLFFEDQLDFTKYLNFNEQLISFLLGSAVLGILCSWLGAYLWNKAALHLPVPLAGLLMIFETLFGLSYVYLFEQRFPPIMEFLGIVILLAAIIYGIRSSTRSFEENQIIG
jgi:drug/metabolite transporter (DMT)-like permease